MTACQTNGKVESWGHLSFDQYNQDQVFFIDAVKRMAIEGLALPFGIGGITRSNSISDALEASLCIQKLPEAQQEAEWKKLAASHPGDSSGLISRTCGGPLSWPTIDGSQWP